MVETDEDFRVSAELPGVDGTDIEVLLTEDNTLTIRGEKKIEDEDRERRLHERFYGRFERRISLPDEVEADKVEASFKNGVLTVKLPRSAKAKESVRRIPLQAA
jgi:HSP20 family protein